eukprot:SAG31_NODE_10041_length_1193_cov_1.193962_1_plen_44_part_00
MQKEKRAYVRPGVRPWFELIEAQEMSKLSGRMDAMIEIEKLIA